MNISTQAYSSRENHVQNGVTYHKLRLRFRSTRVHVSLTCYNVTFLPEFGAWSPNNMVSINSNYSDC